MTHPLILNSKTALGQHARETRYNQLTSKFLHLHPPDFSQNFEVPGHFPSAGCGMPSCWPHKFCLLGQTSLEGQKEDRALVFGTLENKAV